jgi:two-component system response regulator GlrR
MIESNPTILIVDDDAHLLELLSIRLIAAGYKTETAQSAEIALNYLDVSRPQLVISDMRMSGMDGMALFEHIHRTTPTLPVIILTAHGTIPDAVAAVQRGVFGYLAKPFDSKTLLLQIAQALRFMPGTMPQTATSQAPWRKSIVTHSAVMEDLLTRTALIAEGDASVLIYGESGVGKELFAHAIHDASKRCHQLFVAVNCAAIPEQLLESELFGHVRGAFTGAVRDHKGLFQLAEGGTLFLDEIGDMPLLLQTKLLRVLQEKQIRPVGSTQTVPVDVRIISATHRDLRADIAAGSFREDLYYRLDVVALTIPALSQRREDISLLANHFLSLFSAKYDKNINGFSPEAMEILMRASWPGNVRQLINIVEQCVALSLAPLVSSALVQEAMHEDEERLVSFEDACKHFERDYLVRVLKVADGNVAQAARLAKRNRTEFYKLLKRYQLEPAVFKQHKASS